MRGWLEILDSGRIADGVEAQLSRLVAVISRDWWLWLRTLPAREFLRDLSFFEIGIFLVLRVGLAVLTTRGLWRPENLRLEPRNARHGANIKIDHRHLCLLESVYQLRGNHNIGKGYASNTGTRQS